MKRHRRWFQYSLRSFLILLTVSAVWLGVVVHRAAEQREAVKVIQALGGVVYYDFQEKPNPHKEARFMTYFDSEAKPDNATPFRELLGNDAFSEVVAVDLSYRNVTDADLLWLHRLRRL